VKRGFLGRIKTGAQGAREQVGDFYPTPQKGSIQRIDQRDWIQA
jgi:hypothetical protein